MYPILFRTRYFFVYGFTAVYALGILLTLGLLIWRKNQAERMAWLNISLLMLGGALLVGRLTFWLTQQHYYAEQPDALYRFWQGGLTYHGVLTGALLGLWLWQRANPKLLLALLDALALPFALLTTFGWFACWLEGCGYGALAPFGFFSADLPDSFGVFDLRYQTQLFGMIWSGLVLGWVVWVGRRGGNGYSEQSRNGRLFLHTTLLLTIGQGLLTLWRGDTVIMLQNIRIDTGLYLLTTLICLILLQYSSYRS